MDPLGTPQRFAVFSDDLSRIFFSSGTPFSPEQLPWADRATWFGNVSISDGNSAIWVSKPTWDGALPAQGTSDAAGGVWGVIGGSPSLDTVYFMSGATHTPEDGESGRAPRTSWATYVWKDGQLANAKAVVLDPENSVDPALVCDYDKAQKADCPQSSVIGKAVANTPVLDKPLAGDVHLVQGIRFGPSGNRIRTTPSLLVKLRGEVAINLRAHTTVTNGRLVTTFPQVPDAPVSRFRLDINGGKKGILVITRTKKSKIDICKTRQTADIETDGHHGRTRDYKVNVKRPCTTNKANKAKKAKRANKAKTNKR